MKAPDFDYVRPRSLDEALAVLEAHGDDAVPLAGGQSLLPALAMRLSHPEMLVDLGGLDELRGIREVDGRLHIGAMTCHADVLDSAVVAARLPLITEALRHVGHVAIRNRGTFGGSLSHADPAAELPACVLALGGEIVLAGSGGERAVEAPAFFTGMFETARRPDELVVEIRLPVPDPGHVTDFRELTRRHGDFAMAGLVSVCRIAPGGVESLRLAYFGCTDRHRLADRVAREIEGQTLPLDELDALDAALAADLDPSPAPELSVATKLHLAKVLTGRALAAMHRRAA